MAFALRSSVLMTPTSREETMSFVGFPYGLNKSVGDSQLELGELTDALNLKYTDDGKLQTRPGLRKVTVKGTNSGAAIKAIASATVAQEGVLFDTYLFDAVTFGGGEYSAFNRLIVTDANNYLYYLEGDDLTLISSTAAEGKPVTVPFAGSMIIMDGSYMKYWNGNIFRLCYDDGSGTSAYQMDDTDAPNDGSKSLYNGATTKYGCQFTTQAWSTGYTIPITRVKVVLAKSGSPTGNAVAKLYDATHANALATSSNFDVSTLTTSATATEFEFALSSTYQMEPSTTYFLSIEYAGGDSGNYLKVYYDTLASGYTDEYYDGSWHDGTARLLMAVQPGRPPKASFGCTYLNRLFFIDPDNPGWVRYTNVNTQFDFSTASGAGYIGMNNDNSQNFPVGAIAPLYGNLYVFGRTETPYMIKISGTDPDDFAQALMLQQVSAVHQSTAATPNDIWFANETGAYNVRGVQEYGDIRMGEAGSPVASTISSYFTSDAFGAYNPIDGQYLLKLAGYNNVLVAHTRLASKLNNTIRYPWTEYYFNGVTPTAFGFVTGTFYVGGSDGHLYALDSDYLDNGAQPSYSLKTCILEHPFSSMLVKQYFLSASSSASVSASLSFYRNGGATSFLTRSLTITKDRTQGYLSFDCRNVQLKLDSITITNPLTIGGIILKGVPMEA